MKPRTPRNVQKWDRKSKYVLLIGVRGTVEDKIVGDNPASGLGLALEETLGARPKEGMPIEEYFNLMECLHPSLPKWLKDRYSNLKDDYDSIKDDSRIVPFEGEFKLADKEHHIHFSFGKQTVSGKKLIELVIRDDTDAKRTHDAHDAAIKAITHDGRNWAGAALMALNTAEPQINDYVRSLFDIARRCLQNLEGFFEDHLLYLLDGDLTVRKSQYDLNNIVRDAYEKVRLAAEEKGISINYEQPHSAPIQANRERLEAAFMNVFINAIKYSEEGSIINCAIKDHPNREGFYKVQVRNPAVISSDEAHHIFTSGYRQGKAIGDGGFGVGLSNARDTVSLHGGKLSPHTDEKSYLEIMFELPKG